jgi:hypothetical protein
MVVGPRVTKFTYLLDLVEVSGVVLGWTDKALGVGSDGFDLALDDNYAHLPMLVGGGSRNLHCETYPIPAEQINHDVPWPLEMKPPGQLFQVKQPSSGQTRELAIGDHIRLRGRPVIENGHPQATIGRGLLQIGYVFLELHPFDWTGIELVEPPPANAVVQNSLIIAAPLYDMIYSWSWLENRIAGVDNCLFFEDDGTHFHNSVQATIRIMAPAGDPNGAIYYAETVQQNGTGKPLNALRTITQIPGGIEVSATVNAPLVQQYGPVKIADVNDPANQRSLLVVTYQLARQPLTIDQVWHNGQTAVGVSAAWTGWNYLSKAGDKAKTLALAAHPDGRMHAVIMGT